MLSGCGLPLTIQIVSLALNGLSFVLTQISTTNHAVSAVSEEDYALHRSLKGQAVCRAKADKMAKWTGKR